MTPHTTSIIQRMHLAGRRQAVLILAAATLSALCLPVHAQNSKTASTIVFVCEHGSVKSLIATQWFNKIATERGLTYRAISRGLSPDMTVPRDIRENLAKDALPVGGFTPRLFGTSDLGGVARVVAIGVNVKSITQGSGVPVEAWDDIPAASENYAASRDAMVKRIDSLLADLKDGSNPGQSKRPKRPRA